MFDTNLNNIDPETNFQNLETINNICKYYTIEQFNLNTDLSLDFTLLNYNIRSFHSNGTQFECFLESFKFNNMFITLTETWNNEENLSLCEIEGFKSFHSFRKDSRGGGVSVFCPNSFFAQKINDLSICNNVLETCAVKLIINGTSLILFSVYRPPNGNIEDFLLEIGRMIRIIYSKNDLIIITGDFNIDLTNLNSTPTNNLNSLMYSLFFFPVITKPTRFSNNSATLDQIWLNKETNMNSGIIYYDITDHCPCFLNFNIPSFDFSNEKVKIEMRPFDENKFNSFLEKLRCTNWNDLLNYNDINECYDVFQEYLNNQYCIHFPKKIKYISRKRSNKPWINSEIKRKINQKSQLYKLYKLGSISKETNNKLKNKITKEIKEAKDLYFMNSFKRYKNDMKKSWELIRQLSGNNNKKESIVKLLDGETEISDFSLMADKFIEYFSNIATHLDENLPNSTFSPYTNIRRNPNSFFIYPVNEDECLSIISSLKLTKSHIDVIPVKLFKLISPYISNILCKILNISFCSGIFPENLKMARITPVFKNGDKRLMTNYRPISSLPYIGKIFERCMTNRLIKFIDNFSILSESQFGFRRKLSTQDAIVDLLHYIHESLNYKKHHFSVLIDLRKAFDTVNHDILLHKLDLYGIRGVALDWIRSYMTDRQSYVGLGNVKSKICTQNIGVVQGSIIGPLLFLIYINDLPDLIKRLIRHFTLTIRLYLFHIMISTYYLTN